MPRKVGQAARPLVMPREERHPAPVSAQVSDGLLAPRAREPGAPAAAPPPQRARAVTLGGILGSAPLERPATGSAWADPSIAAARVAAIVERQNQLRLAKGLPVLAGAPTIRADEAMVSMPSGFDGDETTAGQFSFWGDWAMRAVYGDLFSLNEVYAFDGSKLVSATPYAQWVLEQLPTDTVRVHRKMSEAEAGQWRQASLDAAAVKALGAQWGHQLDGRPTAVLHFSTDAEQTSAAGDGPTMTFEVPKSVLLQEAKRGALWSSATELPPPGQQRLISELVLPSSLVERLVRLGQLTFEA